LPFLPLRFVVRSLRSCWFSSLDSILSTFSLRFCRLPLFGFTTFLPGLPVLILVGSLLLFPRYAGWIPTHVLAICCYVHLYLRFTVLYLAIAALFGRWFVGLYVTFLHYVYVPHTLFTVPLMDTLIYLTTLRYLQYVPVDCWSIVVCSTLLLPFSVPFVDFDFVRVLYVSFVVR